MVDFSKMKKTSGSNLDRLNKVIESMNTQYSDDSNEYWKCEVDKAGNGYAIFRFLPAPPQDGDDALPFVKFYDHGFQGPGGWYIEKSLTSLGQDDPLSKYNSELWNSGIEANKELARKQKRRLHYVSNIFIIKDSKHPEYEGKVFKFQYGKKIFEKLTQAMNQQFEDDVAFDPFDFWEGANFKLKIRKQDGFQNYDLSSFDSPSPLFNDDDKLKEIWEQEFSLKEVIDPKNFKTYDELKVKLERVLKLNPTNESSLMNASRKQNIDDVEKSFDTDLNSGDSDTLDYFSKLIDED